MHHQNQIMCNYVISRVIQPERLVDKKLHSLNSNLLPDVIESFKELGLQRGPLKLVKPQFETPLPPLKLAVRVLYTLSLRIV